MAKLPHYVRPCRVLPLVLIAAVLATPALAATLTGVVRSNLGVAVANVDIDAIDQCSGDNVFLATDHTAADGTFSFSLASGTYDLHFIPPAGSTLVSGDRQDLVVSANAALGTITLNPGPLVSGTILTPALVPAANVDLKFVNVTTGQRVFITKTVSDAAGHWSARVPAGTWNIDFRPPTGSAFADVERLGLVVGAGDISGLSNTLKTGFTITGVVRDRNNNPLKGVDLSAVDVCTDNTAPTAHDNTDATGAFSIVVPAGTYTFTLDPPACKLVEAKRVEDVVVTGARNLGTFVLRNAFTVSGLVKNPDGTAMVDARLKFFDDNLTGVPRQGTTRDHTSATGSFAVAVPPGTYDINIEPPTGSSARVLHLNNLVISNNTNLGTQTTLAGVAISSHLQAPGGAALENVNVNVVDHATRASQRLAHDATDVAGNYRVVVAPGTYDIQYETPVCDGMAPTSVDSVRILATTVLPTLTLQPGIHLVGTVTDTLHAPVAGADIDVFPAGSAHKLYTPGAQTAVNGGYDVFVPSGQYDMHFLPAAGSRLRASAVSTPLETSSAALAPVLLPPGLLLSGSVRDAGTLAAIDGVRIEVYPRSTQSAQMLCAHNESNATGFFSFPVDSGSWDVRYVPPAGTNYAEVWRRVLVSADLALPVQSLAPVTAGVAPVAGAGSALELAVPRPNPARGEVRFEFQALHGVARLTVWDVTGRRVAALWDAPAPGPTTVRWDTRASDGRPVPPGIYLVRLSDTTGGSRLRRITVMP